MKNIKTRATALALTTLMTVSAIGTASASAATSTTTTGSNMRTLYFINNKKTETPTASAWLNVYGYAWNSNGAVTASFPGDQLKKIGTTEKLGTSNDVYSMTVDANKVTGVLFAGKGQQVEQSSDIILSNESANCFYLDKDNKAVACKDFKESDIKTTPEDSTTPTTPTTPSDDKSNMRTLYLINNKKSDDGWQNVYGYAWNAKGEATTAKFPGNQLEKYGTITMDGTSYDVYSMTVDANVVTGVKFSEDGKHLQRSTDIILSDESANCFYLDKDNKAVAYKDFKPSDITPVVKTND